MAQWGPVARWGRRALSALGPWGPGSITGRRRSISLSVGASGIFGSRGNSEKKFSLQDVAELIRTRACQRVVVMVGAGISTPSGIPDFRSPGSGLYSNLQQYNIPYPEAIFELEFFSHNPKPFFTLAKELYPGNYRPNIIHYFFRLLHDKGLLLRLYTQNIDGLERVSGIPVSKLVEAHGTFASATCTVCRRSFPEEDFWCGIRWLYREEARGAIAAGVWADSAVSVRLRVAVALYISTTSKRDFLLPHVLVRTWCCQCSGLWSF
ncbi:NAD-dependent protein deacetylase sirtuin-3, mitochondrial isoform X4 [Heterocephalus glaber]|uniref:NAD-dependent protein deacetylase sirtuin-3, mitochondrial isoform X4 n=1 Tax=Heterocephalus glaber TaxID=10181 RepID=A0AAX6TIW5_HETGA|nr:NAD-dependent protein deacetylase sirtuin-3, mitochondrial isoform X4 [Heterocephalus glaber]